jgi:phospholipid/cholesterol/gamma-HCH transport system substrate-binding protein
MSNTRKAVVGIFVLGGILLFAAGLFLIGDRRLLFAPQFELYTAYGKVTGLQIGTKVRVSGLDAGEVLDIMFPSRPSEKFRVRMRLRDDLRPLVRTDSVSAVQTDGIVGSAFIQIARGSDAAAIVVPGSTIEGMDPIEFSDLIQEGRDTFRLVNREVGEMGDQISGTLAALTDVVQTTNSLVTDVGTEVKAITGTSTRIAEDVRSTVADARSIVRDVRAGQGTIGRLLTDDAPYERWNGIAAQAEQTVTNFRAMSERTRGLVDTLTARDGAAQQIVEGLRDTLADTREVMSDVSEATEALKRNFLFRGFFRQRGFFDLDAVTRQAYQAGALEGKDRTALRIWIESEALFSRTPDGTEVLTEAGRRRLEAAMSDLVRYPRDSPLVVEGYADSGQGQIPYLVSTDRAQLVRDFLLTRFRRRVTLTGIMPMSDQAVGSPRGNQWSGVALALFVRNDALMGTP